MNSLKEDQVTACPIPDDRQQSDQLLQDDPEYEAWLDRLDQLKKEQDNEMGG